MSSRTKIFEKVEMELNSDYLSIVPEEPMRVLSSAVLNSGFGKTNCVLNYHVEKDFDSREPGEFLKGVLENLGLPEDTVGMMTAAETDDPAISTVEDEELKVCAVVTVGLSKVVTAGYKSWYERGPGTLNIVVLVDGCMGNRAMVDAVRTATEAKTVAMKELDVRNTEGSRTASGTPTDSVVIASTEEGPECDYAGPTTLIGELIGRAVREAVREGLKGCGITPSRSLEERLDERGISFEDLLDTAEEAFVFHPDSSSEEETVDLLREELKKWMNDVNVGSLVIGGLYLNEVGDQGNLPALPVKDFESDPVHLISDEILGMRIANYINGVKGVFEFERIDRSKPGILKELGPFTDDIVGGLIAGVCSRVHER